MATAYPARITYDLSEIDTLIDDYMREGAYGVVATLEAVKLCKTVKHDFDNARAACLARIDKELDDGR